MGSSSSSEKIYDLHHYVSACNIHNHIEYIAPVKGSYIPKGDSNKFGEHLSPSLVTIIKFKSNSRYLEKPIQKAFVKTYFPSYRNVKHDGINIFGRPVAGLDYETRVYTEVVSPLVDFNVCPNFIRTLFIGRCNLQKVYTLYGMKKGQDLQEQLKFQALLYLRKKYRRKKKPLPRNIKLPNPSTVSVSINETFDNVISLSKLWKANRESLNLGPILFQVAAACYVMSLSKMMHQDLHLGNVLIEILNQPRTVTYIYNTKIYTFSTRYIVHVFDFDRAVVARLGKNHNFPNRSESHDFKYFLNFGRSHYGNEWIKAVEFLKEISTTDWTGLFQTITKHYPETFRHDKISKHLYVCHPSHFDKETGQLNIVPMRRRRVNTNYARIVAKVAELHSKIAQVYGTRVTLQEKFYKQARDIQI